MLKKLLSIPVILAAVAVFFNENLQNSILEKVKSFTARDVTAHNTRLFTSDELKLYNGIDQSKLYLSILGKVFDVSKGEQHYGPGKSYHFFIGRDGSRSFITGEFEGEPNDKVADLAPQDLIALNDWIKFYEKDYKKIGKLIGTYYNKDGKLTPYGKQVKKLIKSAQEAKASEDLAKKFSPSCNIEWDVERGTHVWCSDKSGGIDRNWVGYPRKKYEPGSDDFKCVCVNKNDVNSPNLKEYENCDSDSISCYIK